MSVPLYSCTCEARFVSVPTTPYTEERSNASIYWKRVSTPHILEARFSASMYWKRVFNASYII